ncbi:MULTISPECIES: hypothetical protein [unclassified Curtobacterium]|uniref:hypothetical protein n=1 Tax=unclassified Curtobacterium TaxID=257496 RepID=UPI000825C2F3|nr:MULTISPECIES: hypothetical protein [unclassified Curtobacterium]WIA99936.1 hypothetical protein QOL15_15720 [Curtobacterium sp. MCBA15_012]
MTEQQTDGWAAVPHVETIRGTQEAAAQGVVAPPRPPRRKLRRGALIGIIAGGTAVVLLAVAGIVTYSVQSASHSPDRPVRAFLDDLTAGRVDDALDTAGIEHGKDDVLLTDAAYAKASSKITGYRIAATDTSGDTAQVRAYLRQGGRDVSTVFTLDRTGTDLGVFPVWKMEAPQLGRVDVSVRGPANTGLQIAGKSVTTSTDGAVSLKALPGKYSVAVDGGKWYTADKTEAVVSGFRSTASIPVSMRVTLTDAGKQAAQQAVDRWVDGCIASTEAEPPGCSFYAYGSNPSYTYTNKKWTLETRPAVSVGDWLSRGFFVTTTTYGRAKYTADFTGPDGPGTASAGPMNVNATGYITGFTDEGATFESAVGNGARDSGS